MYITIIFKEIMAMDLTDRKILKILEENSKSSLSDISRMVNLSIQSVRERINKMKDLNIIEKYTIDINYNSLGFGIDVIINISIKNNLYTDFKTFIKDQENVEFCYRISGESCFVFKMHFETMDSVEEFIDKSQYYGHTKTQFIFSRSI